VPSPTAHFRYTQGLSVALVNFAAGVEKNLSMSHASLDNTGARD